MSQEAAYEEFLQENDKLEQICPKKIWDWVDGCNSVTDDSLSPMWLASLRKNVKKLYRKHGSVYRHFHGFGANRAVIAVGAGPSFNLNKNVLKWIYKNNLQYPLEDQPFIIIASNHQFKPLLKMGIVPHFVMLIDGGEAVYDQLCKDIPEQGQKTMLITCLQANYKVLRDWDRQGRHMLFYMHSNDDCKKKFYELTKKDPDPISIPSGGNVINGAWLLAMRTLRSRIFMAVGNDLSFPYSPDYDKRVQSFYADGDYSVNIKNKRDEARERLAWQGVEYEQSALVPDQFYVNLKTVGTSKQLFVYKLWAEMHAVAWSDHEVPFQYYNCSEAGIMGVTPKSYESKDLYDKDNWQLLDEVIPKRWRTRRLIDAASEYMEVRRRCLVKDTGLIDTDVRSAGVLQVPTATASIIDQKPWTNTAALI